MGEQPNYVPEEFRYDTGPEGIEAKEEGQFTAARIENLKDPRLESSQKLLEGEFGKDEIDSSEVIRDAMKDKDEPYMVFATENEEKEMVGTHHAALLRIRDAEGGASEQERILYGIYTVIPEQFRRGGHGGVLVRDAVAESYKQLGEEERIIGRVTEASAHENEGYHNHALKANEGMRRLYYQNEGGEWVEAPYQQIPLDWNKNTGEAVAENISEHLMYAPLDRAKDTMEGSELVDVVRTIHYYNMWSEDRFKTEEAYQRHEEIVEEFIEQFSQAVEGKIFRMISKAEREEMLQQGAGFIENEAQGKERSDAH